MSKESHTHKYRRTWLDKAKTVPIWRCMLPNCSHYVRKEFLTGRTCICWKCGKEFLLHTLNSYQAKPTCCTRNKNTVNTSAADGLLKLFKVGSSS